MEIARDSEYESIFMVEHEGIISAGMSFEDSDFLKIPNEKIYYSARGGRITIHNPGQLVIYPIINLKRRNMDVSSYVHTLEEWIIDSLKPFGITGERSANGRGIWVSPHGKIGFIGIKIGKGIAYHGLCINVNNDLAPFKNIVPCGIRDASITSISIARGKQTAVEDVRTEFIRTCPFT
jgi:lipoyl(octanoyl) transferase